MSSVVEELKQVLSQVIDVPAADIADDASMATLPAWDSMRHLYLILAIEEKFSVTIGEDDAVAITSLPSIRDALARYGVA